MHLHHHSGHPVSQLETLLSLTQTLLKNVEAVGAIHSSSAFNGHMQHLCNACDLLSTWATGADAALSELLPLLAVHADSGAIAESVMAELCAPLNEYLGERYVHEAMAAHQG